MSDRRSWNEKIIEEFRANDGVVGKPFENTPLLLLHTTGAKSGKERINPLAYVQDDGRHIVVASKGGAPENPDWYYNVVANAAVKVEVGTEEFEGVATPAAEPERTRLFASMVAKNPGFAEYERKVARTIPVIIIERR